MSIHPKAREIILKLEIPAPIKKYFSNDEWEIDLSNNTNPYGENFSEYPDIRQDEIKKIYINLIQNLNISENLKDEHDLQLTPENLLFTVGLMEGIDILLRTFCEPNKDKICILQPTFSAYEHWGLIHNVEIKNISLSGETFNCFSLEEVIQINPKMIFLCNPNNPTGTHLKPDLIDTLCASIDGFVVVDEAYIEFADHPSALFYLKKHKNLIILRTLSKAWGMAGIRCGIILGDSLIINSLRYVQLPFGFSSPTQAIIRQCLSNPGKILDSWQRIKQDRDNLIQELSILESVKKVFNSETNFIMIILKNSQRVLELLKQHKIQVLDCSLSIPHAIRVSLGTEEQNRKFLNVMGEASTRGMR